MQNCVRHAAEITFQKVNEDDRQKEMDEGRHLIIDGGEEK